MIRDAPAIFFDRWKQDTLLFRCASSKHKSLAETTATALALDRGVTDYVTPLQGDSDTKSIS